MAQRKKSILGACVEDCIHVAGILGFLQIAEDFGYYTHFMGPAVPVDQLIEQIKQSEAHMIALSYRLTPDTGYSIITDFITRIKEEGLTERSYILGCLPELAKKVGKMEFFDHIYTGGETVDDLLPLLRNESTSKLDDSFYPNDLVSRIEFKQPFPILRAHFGLPSMKKTLKGIETLSKSKALDVISIAPDQAAQEWLHHPEVIKTRPQGTGGVPIRKKHDLELLYQASRCGNHPLLRIYSGTQDLIKNSKWFQETIHNAWAAIPIFWYSELDGRGPCKLKEAIEEHLNAIKWHAEQNIPVEINDPHQWGLRMASDRLVVADAYISARVAKELGVQTYIEQLMFNTPTGNSWKMDLARVLAMVEIVKPLINDNFKVLRETRAGLAYLVPKPDVAKGQLVASTIQQMAVKPHIMHIVSYCEASHAANPEDIIESCSLLKRVIQDSLQGLPNLLADKEIQKRKDALIHEAKTIIQEFEDLGRSIGTENPYLSAETLSEAVRLGLFDAPHLKGNPAAKAEVKTRIIDGKCIPVSEKIGHGGNEKNQRVKHVK